MVDLAPNKKGDRIAVHKDGKVSYLPAKRVDLHEQAVGGGICRYIKRVKNGGLITVCANHVGGNVARLEAVHWRPLAKKR